MHIKHPRKKNIETVKTALGVILSLIIMNSLCLAAPYQPDSPLTVKSEYSPPSSQAITWQIIPARSKNTYTLTFYADDKTSEPVCETKYQIDKNREIIGISWEGVGGKQQSANNGLLIVPGFPAPCDILPAGQIQNNKTYTVSRKSGGRTFIKKYNISSTPVSLKEAIKKGFVPASQKKMPALVMITITDEQNKKIIKQLWPENGTWWVYEESFHRKSWLKEY